MVVGCRKLEINNKFYVLIPPEIVDRSGMKEGEELDFSKEDSELLCLEEGAPERQ